MPTPDYNVPNVPDIADLVYPATTCPTPLSPPSDTRDQNESVQSGDEEVEHLIPGLVTQQEQLAMNNNTGAGMAQSQEDSMYITPGASPVPGVTDNAGSSDTDKMDVVQDENTSSKPMHSSEANGAMQTDLDLMATSSTNVRLITDSNKQSTSMSLLQGDPIVADGCSTTIPNSAQYILNGGHFTPPASPPESPRVSMEERRRRVPIQSGTAKIDQELDWNTATPARDFSYKRSITRYPSSVFQAESKYVGTQQSDRQIYNVNVRILTIDTKQSTCTGYLLIKGLTPEHDTLQTYFTGEIIGGPKQKYSFRTKTADWGASDKTDLTHWARFPPWRSLTTLARQDLDFQYPTSGENWWEQEYIFMRWKEHFLVPDHKTRSIAGASFEGFYYICLNQVEGRISGIYFHSKSEKYQQLELKHEGETGIWHRGVTPAVEFR